MFTSADLQAGTSDSFGSHYTLTNIENVIAGSVSGVTVRGDDGANQLSVDPIFDTYSAAHFEGMGGDDILLGGSLSDTLLGGDGADYLRGNAGADTLSGDAGNDFLVGGAGDDSLSGGAGVDTVTYEDNQSSSVTANLATGTATGIESGSDTITGVENLRGSDYADSLTGDAGSNLLQGRAGADMLNGGAGNDALEGGSGADVLIGGSGNDTMSGGTGNDVYEVTDASDIVVENAGEGIDTVYSTVNLTLWDNVENVFLVGNGLTGIGNALDNSMTGTTGNDVLIGGHGNDVMTGGLGNDTYEVTEAGDVIVENSGEGIDTIYSSIGVTMAANVENLILVGNGLSATGNALGNTMTGTAGNDVLIGGHGNDLMIGGAGNDTYEVTEPGDLIVENAGEGIDTIYSSINLTMAAHVENAILVGNGLSAIGNASDNTMTGTAGDDVLIGGAGIDHMIGGAGNDVYEVTEQGDTAIEAAGGGVDTIYSTVNLQAFDNVENLYLEGSARVGFGNALNNVIVGTSGDDLLYGQLGTDTLTGGAGADTFLYNAYEDSLATNPDHITDFQSGVDHLDLRSLHTSAADKVSTQVINGSTYLYIDHGGDGTNDFLVVLDQITAPLHAGDYLF